MKAFESKKQLITFVVMAVVAGVCIALALFTYDGVLLHTGNKLLGALAFSIGLILCVFLKCDLFTGKAFVYAADVFQKKKTLPLAFGFLGLVFLLNAVGSIAASGLYALSSPSDAAKEIFEQTARTKAELSIGIIFVRAVLCNLFVSLGMFFALKFKDKPALVVCMIVLCIFPFVLLGFEHSVANVGVFSIALMTGAKIGAGAIALNLTFSMLGNLVGGVLIALMFAAKQFEY